MRFFYIILDYVQDIVCHHPPVLWHFSSQKMKLPFPPVKDFVHPPKHSSNNSGTIRVDESKHGTLLFHPIFLMMSIIPFAAIAFYTGVVIRILMLTKFYTSHSGSTQALNLNISNGKMDWGVKKLPPPTIIQGKEVPSTTYTSEYFPVAAEATRASYTMQIDRNIQVKKEEDYKKKNTNALEEVNEGVDDEASLYLPAGQHLLVDIKNVDPIFLNSEERLAEAMIQLVDESKLTLLSYHCQ